MGLFLAAGGPVARFGRRGRSDGSRSPSAKPRTRHPRTPSMRSRVRRGFPAEVGVEGQAVTDQVNTMLAALPQVTLVNRDQIKKVAEEQQMALSGLVDNAAAVKIGKFLSAQYIIVGRASKIGQTFYLVLKIVDVETTVQTTVSAKARRKAASRPCWNDSKNRWPAISGSCSTRWPMPRTPRRRIAQAGEPLRGQGAVGGGRGDPRRSAAARSGCPDGHHATASQVGAIGDRAQGSRGRLEGIALADRVVWRAES